MAATPVGPLAPFSSRSSPTSIVRASQTGHRQMPARSCLAAVAVAQVLSPPWPLPTSQGHLLSRATAEMPARRCLAAGAAAPGLLLWPSILASNYLLQLLHPPLSPLSTDAISSLCQH